jgi:hypothetical protein
VKQLLSKLESIKAGSNSHEFILADARDADMAWGITSFGKKRAQHSPDGTDRYRTKPEFLDEIRSVVDQGIIDIVLASTSTMYELAHTEKLFKHAHATPAVRINDATDIWIMRGSSYSQNPSVCFRSSTIAEAQYGNNTAATGEPIVNLGLYSITFNNNLQADLNSLNAFREFRREAEIAGFKYFLEVFAPNSPSGLAAEDVPYFMNDCIARTLAGVTEPGRPLFLKIPYFGPRALEELATYDPSVVVGVLGGSSGTTHDAFKLIADAQKYGARVALFGRKIKDSEHPLEFIRLLRAIVMGETSAQEAVKQYHATLKAEGYSPKRSLEEDLVLTHTELSYA